MAEQAKEYYTGVFCKNTKCGYWFEVSRTILMKRNNTVDAKCPHCRTSVTVKLDKRRG